MSMRNFWLDSDIDGRQTSLSGGPRASDGGMNVTVRQRENGKSVVACKVKCYKRNDGLLVTSVRDKNDNVITEVVTER